MLPTSQHGATDDGEAKGPARDHHDGEALPSPAGSTDNYDTLDRATLVGAIRDRERDLAQTRRTLHDALDANARLQLDVSIHQGALADRERDLAQARGDFHGALDSKAHLALDASILERALADRERDLAQARSELQILRDNQIRFEHDRDILQGLIHEQEEALIRARAEVADIQARYADLEKQVEAAKQASQAHQNVSLKKAHLRKPKPASAWEDFIFYVKYMFNLHDR